MAEELECNGRCSNSVVLTPSSTLMQAFIFLGLVMSAVLITCVTRVAKAALEKALAETGECLDGDTMSQSLPLTSNPSVNLHEPLIIKIDTDQDNHEH